MFFKAFEFTKSSRRRLHLVVFLFTVLVVFEFLKKQLVSRKSRDGRASDSMSMMFGTGVFSSSGRERRNGG